VLAWKGSSHFVSTPAVQGTSMTFETFVPDVARLPPQYVRFHV
jgi:hypothetical protein